MRAVFVKWIERWLEIYAPLRGLVNLLRGQQVIMLDYPVKAVPRHGYSQPSHPQISALLDAQRATYQKTLESFLPLQPYFLQIPRQAETGATHPCWQNQSLPALDAVSIYSFIALQRPRHFVEIGSGNSTRFARQAIGDHKLATQLTAIDPFAWLPRVASLCDRWIPQRLEALDLALFDELDAGDILFIDGSHRCLMNSDATVAFLDVLPRLRPNVLVGVHDILLPDDYPPALVHQYYSEQYLLAAYLLGKGHTLQVVLPGHFVTVDPGLSQILAPLWQSPHMAGIPNHGQGFWFLTG